ncbi:MAG TPA: DUF177 domain-containing protein [Candidatus Stackebrandtia faecavium]|nr:DUF177 domain-containing protein [Candidatus Stackebrandtia faecavium]
MTMQTTPQLDPREPLVADTRTLPRSPGSAMEWATQASFDEALGLELIGVPAGEPVHVDVNLTSVSEGVLVTGNVSTTVKGECGRCLTAINEPLTVEVSELYAYPDSTTAETTDDEEVPRLQGDLLDLEPVVRDGLVFAMPSTPLCRADCPGLCADCGEKWDDLPADHAHESLDPRWAELKKLL